MLMADNEPGYCRVISSLQWSRSPNPGASRLRGILIDWNFEYGVVDLDFLIDAYPTAFDAPAFEEPTLHPSLVS